MSATPPGLIGELNDAGAPVRDLWELVNTKTQYRAAIPVLMEWLRELDARVPLQDQPKLREALVRALSVPAAKGVAAPLLIEEFKRAEDPSGLDPRWVVGNALSVVADDSVFDELVALAQDRKYGKARQMIVLALGSSRVARAVPVLIGLLGDDDVAAHAVRALGKLRPPGIRPALVGLLGHPDSLVRREAKRALARLPA